MLLLLIVFFVFSTCTVLLEYYAVQYYYRFREARQREKKDGHKNNETPTKNSAAPALMETPTGTEGADLHSAIICPSSSHVSQLSVTPVTNNVCGTCEDAVSYQTIRKKETLPLPDGSIQTIVHIRKRAVLHDGSVKETVTVKVLEEDGSIEKEMEQTTSNIYHPLKESRNEDDDFDRNAASDHSKTPKKKLYQSPTIRKFVPEGLLQPMLSPKMKKVTASSCIKQLAPYYIITEEPQLLLPKNLYLEPRVAMDGDNAVVACKQSIHFFAYVHGKWEDTNIVSMSDVYCPISVAMSKNTAVIGVPKGSSGSEKVTTGVVYVYEKQNKIWREVSTFVPPLDEKDNFRGANFGYAVDIDEDTIVIGAPSKDSFARKGKVYVLKRCHSRCLSDCWVQHTQLEMKSLADNVKAGKDSFGSVVSVCKNMIAVSDGGKTVALFRYNQDLDSYISIKGSLIDDANRAKSCASIALTTDGGVILGCESNAAVSALFYHTNHPGPSSGQYILHQSLGLDEDDGNADSKKINNSRSNVSVYENSGSQMLVMGATSNNYRVSSQIKLYKRLNESWNQIAAIEDNNEVGTIFGNSVALSNNHVMIASSNNVYAYNLDK